MRVGIGWLACAALAAAGCKTYYHTYRDAHPDWVYDFPREGMPLDELLASIFARREHAPFGDGSVRQLLVIDLGADPPAEIPIEELECGSFQADPDGHYLVAPRLACLSSGLYREAHPWYLLDSNALVAYQQVSFHGLCWYRDPKQLNPDRLRPAHVEWIRCHHSGRCR